MSSATMTTDCFNKLISCTKNFLKPNSTSTIRGYIRLEFSHKFSRVTAIAIDGYRLSVEHCAVLEVDNDFVAYIKPNVKLQNGKVASIEMVDEEKLCKISCGGFHFGFDQPDGDYMNWASVIPNQKPTLRIAFNGSYLEQALSAAKTSAGGFSKPVVLEFTDALSPVLFRTGSDDVKMVLPVRTRSEWQPLNFSDSDDDPEVDTDA